MPGDSFSQPRIVTKNEGGSSVQINTSSACSQPTLKIYFSRDQRKRECALVTDFPEQLVEALEIRPVDVAAEISQLLQVHLDALNSLLVRKGIISGTKSHSSSEEAPISHKTDENGQAQVLDDLADEKRPASSTNSQHSSDAAEPGTAETESSISPIAETEEVLSSFRPVRNRASMSRPSTSLGHARTPLESHGGRSSSKETQEAFFEEPRVGTYNALNRSHNIHKLIDFARNAGVVFNARAQTTRRTSSAGEDAFDLSELDSALQEAELSQTLHETINVRLNEGPLGGGIPDSSQEYRARDSEVGFLGEFFVSYYLLES